MSAFDDPKHACPVASSVAAIWRNHQTAMDDNSVKEVFRTLVNSRVGPDAQYRRAILVADWCERVVLPMWCDLVPSLHESAAALRALPEASTVEQLAYDERTSRLIAVLEACEDASSRESYAAMDFAADFPSAADVCDVYEEACFTIYKKAWITASMSLHTYTAACAVGRASVAATCKVFVESGRGKAQLSEAKEATIRTMKAAVDDVWSTTPKLIERLLGETSPIT